MDDNYLRNHMANARGWVLLALAAVLFAVMLLCSGCFTRTVYVPAGQPVRLRQDVRSVKVWVIDSSGKPVPSVKDLKEGGFYSPTLKD